MIRKALKRLTYRVIVQERIIDMNLSNYYFLTADGRCNEVVAIEKQDGISLKEITEAIRKSSDTISDEEMEKIYLMSNSETVKAYLSLAGYTMNVVEIETQDAHF